MKKRSASPVDVALVAEPHEQVATALLEQPDVLVVEVLPPAADDAGARRLVPAQARLQVEARVRSDGANDLRDLRRWQVDSEERKRARQLAGWVFAEPLVANLEKAFRL